MDFEQSVAYYHSLERFGIQPGLERIRALCRLLGDPQDSLRFIHVAGTNGKGSTCTEIASVLTQAGYRTGLYTSPYVIEFRERIRLDGEMISPEDLIGVTEKVRSAAGRLAGEGVSVTEFEAVTAAAFLYYAEKRCDAVVLETGLGGRFDATNIIREPVCTVITSVSFDHVRILGNTLAEIASEKCGIIKSGRPVITTSHQDGSVLDTISKTAALNGSELIVSDPAELQILHEDISGSDVLYRERPLHIPFAGRHQIENAALAIQAIETLRRFGFSVSEEQLRIGLAEALIPARIEVISKDPLVILDGCHNEGSTAALAAAVRSYLPEKRILAVMGMMADKDIVTSLSKLLPLFSKVIAVTPSNARSMQAESFCDMIRRHGVPAQAVSDPIEGVDRALDQLRDYDALIVCGSLYLASDVRSYLVSYHFDNT
ncbi:MAG: bifunctional folylpolyglutamate synthase/dihydrofolate synthase [Clostridia bacterium]|nr:bifunctional folylpolyglutamate synthase/dihydrofolate synthase [Clostridia bacterium]